MTLAYVFWHRPQPDTDAQVYTDALRTFHSTLGRAAVPGFLGSWSARIPELPWLGADPLYEDRYLISDFTALGRLNEAAVAARQKGAHDAAAARAAWGTAGLYALVQGTVEPQPTPVWWFDKPAGTTYERFGAVLERMQGTIWQRQLTLGPGPEFQLLAPERPGVDLAHTTTAEPV